MNTLHYGDNLPILRTVLAREHSEIGILVTLEAPTKDMLKEAASEHGLLPIPILE